MPWPGAEQAKAAEAAGAEAFCAGEFADTSAYVTASEMVRATSAALVGPGIAYAFARSPFVHAASVRQLNRIAPGRVFLGLGAGTARMNRDWFGVDAVHPARRMAELVSCIRAFLYAENNQTVRYHGDFYDIDAQVRAPVLGRIDVPILLGAFNVHMLRTVGGVADGVLAHALFTDRWWDEVVDPALALGAQRAGRSAEDLLSLSRWGWLLMAIDDADPQRAIEDAKRQIGFYLTVKTYDPHFELHGWQEEVARTRADFAGGDPALLGRHVTDEMLWAIAVCGSSDQARAMWSSRRRLPELGFLSPPGFLVSPRRRGQYAAKAVELAAEIGGER